MLDSKYQWWLVVEMTRGATNFLLWLSMWHACAGYSLMVFLMIALFRYHK